MALFAIQEASGRDFREPIARGLAWLASCPELRGGSLVDRAAGLVWRKVARREPAKFTRYAQAMASGLHPRLRLPLADSLFPPGTIDYDQPYHLGWILHAFPAERAVLGEFAGPPHRAHHDGAGARPRGRGHRDRTRLRRRRECGQIVR
jgi:hypothetical protein